MSSKLMVQKLYKVSWEHKGLPPTNVTYVLAGSLDEAYELSRTAIKKVYGHKVAPKCVEHIAAAYYIRPLGGFELK